MDTFRSLCRAGAAANDPAQLNPLVLAYAGDAVFELFVRTVLIDGHDAKAHALHVMSSRRVRASAQAKAARALFEELSEKERAVFLRGRNAKPHSLPKNADVEDYSYATALEAVLGYVYLLDDQQRLMELMRKALSAEAVVDPVAPKTFRG